MAWICATISVILIAGFVGKNLPDITVKVAALQTGIQASYPSYVPREFSLHGITSENGKIIMSFDGPDDSSFIISEEKSSWDSAALIRNYIDKSWTEEYTTTHEQGLTIFVSNSNAAWVNGGVLYKITSTINALTSKQLRNIVTSL